ncbi:MAG: hypothetical protein VX127_14090 [Myxococcota bacterium]|nr:hypothetical protein [Myxococcota bacterium]
MRLSRTHRDSINLNFLVHEHGVTDIEAFCGDPTSPPELLNQAASRLLVINASSRTYGVALAANPAVPVAGLIHLLRHLPTLVVQNPAFKIRLATDPGFLDDLGPRLHAIMVGSPGMDPRLIRILAESRSRPVTVRALAAQNPQLPLDMKVAYLRHAWPVREGLARNPSIEPAIQSRLAEDPKRNVRVWLARHPRLHMPLFTVLSQSTEHKLVRLALVSNPYVPYPVLMQLHEEGTPMVKERVQRAVALRVQRSMMVPVPQHADPEHPVCNALHMPRWARRTGLPLGWWLKPESS